MADPSNIVAIDDLRILTGFDIEPGLASNDEIVEMLSKLPLRRRTSSPMASTRRSAPAKKKPSSTTCATSGSRSRPHRWSNWSTACSRGPPTKGRRTSISSRRRRDLLIRFRHDGVLHEIMTIPKRLQAGVISRLKIMADLDIAERRIPQDGRIGLTVGGRPIDMRVASLPTVYGEKIVIRLLDRSNVMLRLEDLGFSEAAFNRYKRSFTKPYGAILVTGPTGSGKSTTLYATLNILNTPDKNIITVEDPVEYRLAGINQVQINPKAGLTFASGLRSILRCDPDIIMVGEIRDKETAQIAVESALTGHLVLSTLHTNDAPGALSRLTEMGVEPFLTASAVDCVIAQRLVRKLCEYCREPYAPYPRDARQRLGFAQGVHRRMEETSPCTARSAARAATTPATRAAWASTRSCWSPRRSRGSSSSARVPMR